MKDATLLKEWTVFIFQSSEQTLLFTLLTPRPTIGHFFFISLGATATVSFHSLFVSLLNKIPVLKALVSLIVEWHFNKPFEQI